MENKNIPFFTSMRADDFLSNFVHEISFPAHIKDITNGKYISINKSSAALFGFSSPEKVIGMTINDLNNIMKGHWDITFPQQIIQFDQTIVSTGKPIKHPQVFLNGAGFVRIEKMIKIPIITPINKKIFSIFTFGEDLTPSTNPYNLLSIYKKFYIDKKQAIQKFLQYLNIYECFYFLPTEAELKILLAMKTDSSHKFVSSYLKINNKTVEAHTRNLKEKLKVNIRNTLAILRRGTIVNEDCN